MVIIHVAEMTHAGEIGEYFEIMHGIKKNLGYFSHQVIALMELQYSLAKLLVIFQSNRQANHKNDKNDTGF